MKKQAKRALSHRNTALELTISPRVPSSVLSPFKTVPRAGNIIPTISACNRYLKCIPPQTRSVSMNIRLYDGPQQIFKTDVIGDPKSIQKRLQKTVDEILRFKV